MRAAARAAGRPSCLIAAAIAAAAIAGCGGKSGDEGATAASAQPGGVYALARFAQCRDWRQGSDEKRIAIVHAIRAEVSQTGTPNPNPELSDDRAYKLFQDACANDFAIGFRLYKLYNRAAAFSTLLPQGQR